MEGMMKEETKRRVETVEKTGKGNKAPVKEVNIVRASESEELGVGSDDDLSIFQDGKLRAKLCLSFIGIRN